MYDSRMCPTSHVLLNERFRLIYFLFFEFSNVKSQLI